MPDVDPKDGGYTPIIALPPPTPPPVPTPTPGGTRGTVPPVVEYVKEITCGSAGDFPGSVYRVHYRLDVLMWDTANQKWTPAPSAQVERQPNLNSPIVVTWNEDTQSTQVKHGVKGKLKFKNMSGKKIRLEFYWVPGGDVWTPPDPESDYLEFTIP